MNASEAKNHALALADWIKERGIDFEDAAPILAMTAGLIIGKQASVSPRERLASRIEEGVDIISAMIQVAATFEAELIKSRRLDV